MAETIKVSTEQMESTISSYNTQKGAQSTAYAAIKSAVSGLQGTWMGEAAQAFQDRFAQYYQNVEQSEAKMQDAVDELRKTIDLMTEAEKDKNQTTAQSLEIGTNPFA